MDQAEDHIRTIGRVNRSGRFTPDSDMPVKQLVEDYIARGSHCWSPNTVAIYRLLLRQQIAPQLGGMRASELTASRVQRWIDRLTDTVRVTESQSARMILSGAYQAAVRLRMLDRNPVTGTHPPARPRRQTVT